MIKLNSLQKCRPIYNAVVVVVVSAMVLLADNGLNVLWSFLRNPSCTFSLIVDFRNFRWPTLTD